MKSVRSHLQPKKTTDPTVPLKHTLTELCAKNPQYSIRAFARSTGISHTVLSLVLSGKRRLSRKATEKLANFLELDPKQRQTLFKSSKLGQPAQCQV